MNSLCSNIFLGTLPTDKNDNGQSMIACIGSLAVTANELKTVSNKDIH